MCIYIGSMCDSRRGYSLSSSKYFHIHMYIYLYMYE